jgi:pyruvate dehydrogenase E1 component alpha subunit
MSAESAMAEILGRASGCCCGKGGSMHLTDIAAGVLGSFATVGAGIPVAVGAAWAAQLQGTNQVAVTFFGDGATNIGAFHESLNVSAVWNLPVVFVCENNLYGEYSPIASTTPVTDLVVRAASYGMQGVAVDGNDVLEVYRSSCRAIERARAGEGPTLLEMKTYRHSGHSRGDPAKYRPAEEVSYWLSKDPITRWETVLDAHGVMGEESVAELHQEAQRLIELATASAQAAPQPDEAELVTDVYL